MGYDYASELFSSREEKPVKGTGYDYAKDLISGVKEEAPVGGTYQPTGEISTIKGGDPRKMKYVPGSQPEAGFGALLESSFVDDPFIKAKIFSRARGVPISRYRVGKTGHVEFKDDEGNWQREVGELGSSQIKSIAADVLGHPSTYLAPAGAALGVPGAVGGAMGGEVARKAIAKWAYGEDPSLGKSLIDVGMQGIFALGGEVVGKVVTGAINRGLSRRAGIIMKAGPEASQALLTPEEHAKALWIKQLAEQHGITLAPHQLYDKKGMTNTWKYLRNHPLTSDAVQGFEKNMAQSSEKAMDDFIRGMGGYERGAAELGRELKGTSEKIIRGAEQRVSDTVSPAYEKAFMNAQPVELQPVLDILDARIKTWPDGKSKKVLEGVKKSLTEETEKTIPGKPGTMVEEQIKPKQTLLGWIRQKGGINVREYHDWERKESGVVAMSNQKGRSIDEIMTQAAEDGWILPGTSEKDFVELIQRDIRAAKSGGQRALKVDEIRSPERQFVGGTPDQVVRERVPLTDLQKLQKVIFDVNDLIEGVHPESSQISPSSQKFLQRELEGLKKDLLSAAKISSPDFIEANKLYESLLPPVQKLKSSVVGELTRMRSDRELAKSHGKLFDVQNMPDPELLRYAKSQIGNKDPELWRQLIGTHVRDIWEGLKRTEEGEILNAAGKMQKRMFGSAKQRAIWEAALDPAEIQKLNDLMTIFQRASIGTGKESMTASLLEVGKELSGELGTTTRRLATETKRTLVDMALGKWDDAVMAGRQGRLMEALTSPDVVDQMQKIKKLTPGSRKLIEEFSVLTSMIAEKTRRERP